MSRVLSEGQRALAPHILKLEALGWSGRRIATHLGTSAAMVTRVKQGVAEQGRLGRRLDWDQVWEMNRSRRRVAALLGVCQPIPLMPPHAFPRAVTGR